MTDDGFPRRVAIVGAGLLGGSVAMSLRRNLADTKFLALARNETKRQAALDCGIFDEAFTSLADTVKDCDVVVIGTPVDHIADLACEIAESTPQECLITDVGSTKAGIVSAVEMHPLGAKKFVAAHPIAGSEKTGLQNARADLFDGKKIVITPGNCTDPVMLGRAVEFWQATGGEAIQMTPAEHDTHLAAVSHVPHLMSCLVALRADEDSQDLAGSGWRDITRVAAGDPPMWTAICKENRHAIEKELSAVSDSLAELRKLVETSDDDGLCQWLAEAKKIRNQAFQ